MAAEAMQQRDQAMETLNDMKSLTAEWAYEVGRNEFGSGRWTLDRLCRVSKILLESQDDSSETAAERIAAMDRHVDRMKEVEARVKAERADGRSMAGEVPEAAFYRAEAEYLRARRAAGPGGARGLAQARLFAAQQALAAQSKSYEEGRITLDRLAGMCRALLESERDVAAKDEDRLAAFASHLDRMKQVEAREKAELEVGRATAADVLEAAFYRAEAEYLRARAASGRSGARGLAQARLLAAQQALAAQSKSYEEGRLTLDRLLSMSKALLESERDVAAKDEDRLAAFASHLDRMKQVEAREKAELEVGRGTPADLGEARHYRQEAEYLLAKEKADRARANAGASGDETSSGSLP